MATFKGAVLRCATCGYDFKVPPSRAATAHYCSAKCADAHRAASRKKRVILVCEGCGVRYEERECHADRRRFCSNECRNGSRKYRNEIAARTSKEGNPSWKGGRASHSDGYVLINSPAHPFAVNSYVLEHRLVMESWLRENEPSSPFLIKLGEQLYLSPDYVVHHKDEIKTNNSIGNLVCMTSTEHRRHHSVTAPSRKFVDATPQ